jgi:hypothetical protein
MVLDPLGASAVYATLVPEGSTGFSAQLGIGASVVSASADLLPGDVVYLVVQEICHKPGTPDEETLVIPDHAVVKAHLKHGDTLGACLPPSFVRRLLNLARGLVPLGG